jgi:hypothetical protein
MKTEVIIRGHNFYENVSEALVKPKIKRRPWTPNEDNYLLDHWKKGVVEDICKHLNRSRSSCSTRASILGLYRQEKNNSPRGVLGRIINRQRKLKNRIG